MKFHYKIKEGGNNHWFPRLILIYAKSIKFMLKSKITEKVIYIEEFQYLWRMKKVNRLQKEDD